MKTVYAYVVEDREMAYAYPAAWCADYEGQIVTFDEIIQEADDNTWYVMALREEPNRIFVFRGTWEELEAKYPVGNDWWPLPWDTIVVWQTKEEAFEWLLEHDDHVRARMGLD